MEDEKSIRIEPRRVAEILAGAPAWAKLGLIDRDMQMRERAADTLAALIVARLQEIDGFEDGRQLGLAL
jgi:serine/threonine protein kinase HipA of HipAB toxin-antitoxin module